MALQLSSLRQLVRNKAGIDSSDANVSDTVVTEFVNSAARQVYSMKDWDWLFGSETITTVNGTPSYTPAADWRKSDRIVDTEEQTVLLAITPHAAERFVDYIGIPRFWYVEAGQIHFVPTPTSVRTYKHVYIKAHTVLALDTDETMMPDDYIDLLIIKAAIMIAARMNNTSKHRLLMSEQRDMITALQDEASRSRATRITATRRDWQV